MSNLSLLFVPIVLAAVLAVRLLADRLDRRRIRDDVAARGGEVLEITWTPFGRGWFGEKSDRIYRVSWHDGARKPHESFCKTSLFTGVYWTEEAPSRGAASVAPRAEPRDESAELRALREENRRLRDELDRHKFSRR
ncbi:MAG TPA: hypothetical protein VK824_03745 [Planctomycetota bacterium]|nr:hypothetical protein [Planctomycetota bacterium]